MAKFCPFKKNTVRNVIDSSPSRGVKWEDKETLALCDEDKCMAYKTDYKNDGLCRLCEKSR